jgi:hypothetical protein
VTAGVADQAKDPPRHSPDDQGGDGLPVGVERPKFPAIRE